MSSKTTTSNSKRLSKNEIITSLNNNILNYNTFYAKCNVKYQTQGNNLSFKTTFKINRDSVIWASVSALFGIEIAKTVIFPDSIVVIDHFNNKYFVGDFVFFNDLLGASFDYSSLQNCITNTPFFNIDKQFSFNREENSYSFILMEKEKLESLSYILNISLQSTLPKTQSIKTNEETLIISYEDYRPVKNSMFPFKLNFTIGENSENKKSLELNYLKVKVNQPLQFPFSIPKDYEVIY